MDVLKVRAVHIFERADKGQFRACFCEWELNGIQNGTSEALEAHVENGRARVRVILWMHRRLVQWWSAVVGGEVSEQATKQPSNQVRIRCMQMRRGGNAGC